MMQENTLELLLFATLVATIVAICRYHWSRRRLYELGRKVSGPTSYPIMGGAHVLIGNNSKIFRQILALKKKFGSTYKIWFGSRLIFMLSNVRDIEILLTSYKAIDKAYPYDFLEPFIGCGVFSAKLYRWRKLRRVFEPTFSKKVVSNFMNVISFQSEKLVNKITKEIPKDNCNLYDVIGKCTLDILYESIMGVDLKSQDNGSEWFWFLNRGMEIIIARMLKPWLQIEWIWNLTKDGKMMNRNLDAFRKYAYTVLIEKQIAFRQDKSEVVDVNIEHDSKQKAFLDVLLDINDKIDLMSDKQILDEVILFLVAGSESTTTSICYLLEMMGMHPEVQEKVRREVDEVMGGSDRELTFDDIAKMEYLDMVVKESLRILPTIPVIGRHVNEELELATCTLPADSTATIDIINIHRNPELWSNPTTFRPERFSREETLKSERNAFAWLPFSAGPRNCLGLRFALAEVKTIAARIVRKFIVTTEYEDVESMDLAFNFVIKPVNGWKFKMTKI